MSKVIKQTLPYISALLIVYLISNIVWSQNISSIYFKLTDIKSTKKDTQEAAYNFLVSIRKLPIYKEYLLMYKNVFGNTLEQDVINEDKKRINYVKNLENLLQDAPKSRDLLFKLYIFYKNEGNVEKSNRYLNQIKEIDPNFTSEE